jgi:predicted transcriptional regulator with HTH domain
MSIRYITEAQSEYAASEYTRGRTVRDIAFELGFSPVSIHRAVKKQGITCRPSGRPRRHDIEAYALDEYQSGVSAFEIARARGLSPSSVYKVLNRCGIDVRHNSEYRLYKLNQDAFSNLTPEAEYWLGFLLADGCITEGSRLELGLSRKDRAHLEKFQSFIGSDHPIKDTFTRSGGYTSEGSRVSIRSERLCNNLLKWGITPRKTFTAEVVPELKSSRDFYRGLIDGDGCVHRDRSTIMLLGTENVVSQFLMFVKTKHSRCRNNIRPCNNIFQVAITGPASRAILDALYTNAPEHIRLERKYQRAMAHLNR